VSSRLRRPTALEYEQWFDVARQQYVDDLMTSGSMSRDAAEAKGHRDFAGLLPDGPATAGHLIFRLEADGRAVGWLWLALRHPQAETGVGFIYDISVEEEFRGRGYGRAAMGLAEEEARQNGLHAIALSVFGNNDVARGLYTSLGYRETSVQMRKEL
jgi:ribosomal protein S18 acetylase RimI-like enzyme